MLLDLKQPGDGTQPQEILDKVSSGSVEPASPPAGFWAAKLPAGGAVRRLPLRPRRQGAMSSGSWTATGESSIRRCTTRPASRCMSSLRLRRRRNRPAGSPRRFEHPRTLKGFRMRIFGLGGRVMSRLGAQPCSCRAASSVEPPSSKQRSTGPSSLPPRSTAAAAPGQQAHLCAGLASARDRARAFDQQGEMERAVARSSTA